jgi:putative membrane protein
MKRPDPLLSLCVAAALCLAWSATGTADYAVWLFEISLAVAGILVLVATRRRFPFSTLVYLLVGIHLAVLAAGGKYTYEAVPLGNWLRDLLHLSRNPFDRIGHFFQGFVPAIIAREVLLRTTPLRRGRMVNFLAVCFCLAFSAFYELLEWQIVVWFYPDAGPQWLGMQGDPWDAQQDMLRALLGATVAVLALSRVHDRSMAAVSGRKTPE